MSDPAPSHEIDITGQLSVHRSWLRAVIVNRLGGVDGADDILQEVNVAAIEQKSPLRHPEAVRSWLFQLAVRQTRLFQHRAGTGRRIEQEVFTEASIDETTSDPLTWLLSIERKELVRDAMRKLNDEERLVLIWKYVDGLSYRHIAERSGATVKAVESRIHRAREHLRKLLAQSDLTSQDSEQNVSRGAQS